MSYIDNEMAYERAKEARIANNRRIGGRRRWFAREGEEECQLLNDWLFGVGQFDYYVAFDEEAGCQNRPLVDDPHWINDWDHPEDYFGDRQCKCSLERHPLCWYNGGDFLGNMREQISEWGGLSEKQHAAVKASYERAVKRLAEKEASRAAQHAADLEKGWVGKVGERRDFDVKIEKRFDFENQFGPSSIYIMRDGDENIIVYKGSAFLGARGEQVQFKASVKAHEERDGVKQSIVARPKLSV